MSKSTRAKTHGRLQAQFPSVTAAAASHPHDGALVLATENGFRAILDSLLEGCQIIDRNWRYVYVNPAVASQGQTAPAALIGRTMMEAYPGLESSALFPILERCMLERIPATLNNEFAFADGSTGVFELRVQPVPEGIFILSIDVTEKKRAEDALANERKRLEKIADAVPGLICTIVQHPTGRVTIPYASKAIENIFGFTVEEVTNNFALIAQRVSTEDNARLLGAMIQASETMQAWHSEYRYQHPQRGWIWLEGHATPVRDENGAIHWHGVIMDVTMRKAGEQALYASEEKYRGLVESLDSVVAVVDASGRFHYVNELGARQLGLDQNALYGQTMADLFPEPYATSQTDNIRSVIEGDKLLVVENQSFVGGETRWHRTSLQPLHDDNGRPTRVLVTSTDITQQKATQRALEELNRTLEQRVQERTAQLQDLYDNAPVGYHSLDAQGKFMMINQTELDWLGYTRDEVIGRMTFSDLLTPASRSLFETTFPVFKAHGWIRDVEFDFVRKDGSTFPVSVTAAAVMSPYDEFLMSRSTVSDITERRKAEIVLRARQEELSAANAALAKAARLKDEFLASMSHELRTPLTGILGLSEALQMEVYGALNAKQAKSLHSIEESGRHLLNLINDILDLSKIEAGKLELELSDVNVDDLCQASLRMIKQMAATKEQSVTYSLHPAGLMIRADTRRLKQTIVNLLSNAVKFTPEGGELGLSVEADRARRVIYISVWDKGIGIAPEATGRLFKPFVQLDSSLARSEGGTGLGLSLVQRLVELHGGSVALESTPGQGSRFTIAIPWLEASRVMLERPSLTADIRATIASVLVLDDSPTAVDLVAGYLHELGVQKVIVQTKAEGAMERIRAAEPAAIILDILLPDGSGWDILRQLKADPATSAIPVIVISVIDDRPKALHLGAVEHVLKPVSRSDLQLALNTARRAVETERHEPVMVVSGNPDRETILLAEDHEISRLLVSDFLTAQGYAMLTAQNGNEALQLLQNVRPALILMDIQMPGMDGLEVIRTVRGHQEPGLAGVPIIALTALSMPGDRERCLAMGADLYLSKPVDFKELAVSIRRLLDRQDLTRARGASEG